MSFYSKSLNISGTCVGILVFTFLLLFSSVYAQFPDVEIDVADTLAYPGAKNSIISIYMTNRVDTIAGFNLWLQMDRPDLMVFQIDTLTVYDTTFWDCLSGTYPNCTDSQQVLPGDPYDFFHEFIHLDTIGNFDTTGTLTSGWELIDSRSISGQGTDINIAGIADLPGGSGTTHGIPPSFEGGLLVKVLADIYGDIPDTLTDRTINLLVQTDFKDHFGLSKPDGSSIPWIEIEKPDTSCFQCTQWVEISPGDTICVDYLEITFGDCDSIDVVMGTSIVLDTANIKIFNGSVTVGLSAICGNIDGIMEPVVEVDISDIVYLVEYMFNDGPAPDPMWVANVNCDIEDGDIGDLLAMVEYMFNGGPPFCNCN